MDIAKEKGGKIVREDHVYQALTELGLENYSIFLSKLIFLIFLFKILIKIQYIDVIKETIKEGKNKGEKIDIEEDEEEEVQKATGLEKIEDFSKTEKIK